MINTRKSNPIMFIASIFAAIFVPVSSHAGQYDGVWEGVMNTNRPAVCGFSKQSISVKINNDKISATLIDYEKKKRNFTGVFKGNEFSVRTRSWMYFHTPQSAALNNTAKIKGYFKDNGEMNFYLYAGDGNSLCEGKVALVKIANKQLSKLSVRQAAHPIQSEKFINELRNYAYLYKYVGKGSVTLTDDMKSKLKSFDRSNDSGFLFITKDQKHLLDTSCSSTGDVSGEQLCAKSFSVMDSNKECERKFKQKCYLYKAGKKAVVNSIYKEKVLWDFTFGEGEKIASKQRNKNEHQNNDVKQSPQAENEAPKDDSQARKLKLLEKEKREKAKREEQKRKRVKADAKRKKDAETAKRKQKEKLENDRALIEFRNDPTTSALFNGGNRDLIFLLNESGSAKNSTRTLLGDISFENGQADVCAIFRFNIDKGFKDFVLNELSNLGVSTYVNGLGSKKCKSLNSPRWDLVVFQRGEFLKKNFKEIRPLLENIRDTSFSVFHSSNENQYKNEIQSRLSLAQRIEGEVRTGTRSGYGMLIADNNSTLFCAEESPQQDVVNYLINQINQALPQKLKQSNATVLYGTAERAFIDFKRGKCKFFFGSAKALQLFDKGLRRDNKKFSYHYDWVSLDDYDRVSAELRGSRKAKLAAEEEKRRKSEEQARLREERLKATGETARRELAVLRKKAGPKARAISTNIKSLIGDYLTDSTESWAITSAIKKWHRVKVSEKWEFGDIETEINDYGLSDWKARKIESSVITIFVRMKNRILGVRREACFNLAFINDSEFEVARNTTAIYKIEPNEKLLSCDGTEKQIFKWKTGNKFTSHWELSD